MQTHKSFLTFISVKINTKFSITEHTGKNNCSPSIAKSLTLSKEGYPAVTLFGNFVSKIT